MKFKNKDSMGIFLMTAAISLEYFAWGFVDPFFSIFANGILHNLFLLGILFAVKNFISLCVAVAISGQMRKVPPKFFAIVSKWICLIQAVVYFLAGLLLSKVLLFAAIFLESFSQPMRNVSEQTFLIQHSGKRNASRVMGLNFACKNFAWVFGTFVCGVLLFLLGRFWHLQFEEFLHFGFLLLLPFAAMGIFLLWRIRSVRFSFFRTLRHTPIFSDEFFGRFFAGFSKLSPQLSFSLVLFFLLRLTEKMVTIFVPLLAISLQLELWQVGILMAFLFLPFSFSFLFSALADRFDRFVLVIVGLLLCVVPLVFLTFVQAPLWVALFSAGLAFCLAIVQPANLGIVASLAPRKERAHLAGLEIFFQKAGTIFGAIVLGFVAQNFGLQVVFAVIAVLAFAFALVGIIVKMHSRRQGVCHRHNRVLGGLHLHARSLQI